MSATIPNFVYRPTSRLSYYPADQVEDAVLEGAPLSRCSGGKQYELTPRIQIGRITQSKDRFRDWLVAVCNPKPVTSRWTEGMPRPMPLMLYNRVAQHFSALAHISKAIAESKQILDLKDDWDGEGTPGYSETVWKRACDFVVHNAIEALNHHSTIIQAPKILPGPDGSIDIHWKSTARELLVNIPSDPDTPAQFYGDDFGALQIKGTINPNKPTSALLMWLPEHR